MEEAGRRKSNIVVLENYERVKTSKWASEHPGCNALIVRDGRNDRTMLIKAYALNPEGNSELKELKRKSGPEIGAFHNFDEALWNGSYSIFR